MTFASLEGLSQRTRILEVAVGQFDIEIAEISKVAPSPRQGSDGLAFRDQEPDHRSADEPCPACDKAEHVPILREQARSSNRSDEMRRTGVGATRRVARTARCGVRRVDAAGHWTACGLRSDRLCEGFDLPPEPIISGQSSLDLLAGVNHRRMVLSAERLTDGR